MSRGLGDVYKRQIESSVRRENRKQYVDKIAAVFILQGYLDLLSMRNGADGED